MKGGGAEHNLLIKGECGCVARIIMSGIGFTRVQQQVKNTALEAAKLAKPKWHLIDAKNQVGRAMMMVPGQRMMNAQILISLSLYLIPQPSDCRTIGHTDSAYTKVRGTAVGLCRPS